MQNCMPAEFFPLVTPNTEPFGMIMVYFQFPLSALKPAGIFSIRNIGPTTTLPLPFTPKLSLARMAPLGILPDFS